jgi:hypothetical protein
MTERQAWLARTEQLVTATRKRVPFSVRTTDEGAGFEVTVGTAEIQIVLDSEGWRVARVSPPDLRPVTGMHIADLAVDRDQILERMVNQGLHDLYEGRVPPGPR